MIIIFHKMSKQFIYATDIVLPKSVIGLLDGSEQFCFENPYFSVPGITKPDKKSYIEVKSVSSKFGVMLNSIYIFYKGANNVFTKQYAIGYTETSKIGSTVVKKPKEYYVVKPFDTNDLGRTNRYKLIIMPSKNEICPEDDILAKLDYQFSMVMDVLCIAKILDINLSKYAKMNNKTFYKNFIDDINEIIKARGSKKTIEHNEMLVDSFDNMPIFGKSTRGEMIPIYDFENNTEPAFNTLFMSFYDAVSSIRNKMKGWEKVLQRPNCSAFPTFKYIDYEKRTNDEIEHVKRFDSRLTFLIQLSTSDPGYNPKFPDALVTRQQVDRKNIEKLSKHTLPNLWGGALSDDEKTRGATHRGCLYIVPQPIYRYYEKGNPTIDWRVEKIATQRVANTKTSDYDEGFDFMDELNNAVDVSNEIKTNEVDDSTFIKSEYEIDPDALT